MAPQVGLEPTTLRLTAECSAIELLRNMAALARLVFKYAVNYTEIVTSLEGVRQTSAAESCGIPVAARRCGNGQAARKPESGCHRIFRLARRQPSTTGRDRRAAAVESRIQASEPCAAAMSCAGTASESRAPSMTCCTTEAFASPVTRKAICAALFRTGAVSVTRHAL